MCDAAKCSKMVKHHTQRQTTRTSTQKQQPYQKAINVATNCLITFLKLFARTFNLSPEIHIHIAIHMFESKKPKYSQQTLLATMRYTYKNKPSIKKNNIKQQPKKREIVTTIN